MQILARPQAVRHDDSSLARFFLDRLDTVTLRLEHTTDPKERATLSVACFSIYLDCLDLGVEHEANTLIACLHNATAEGRHLS